MSRCSFLSTYENRVNCFQECPFFCCSETNEICPFKSDIKEKSIDIDMFHEYDFVKNESIAFLDDLYESNQYLRILQL